MSLEVQIAGFIGAFLLAGLVKGVVGFGLPTVILALLTLTLDLTTAMALMLVPSFATNLWQAVAGGNGVALLRRTWPFLMAAGATVWVGALALDLVDHGLLKGLLGVLLALYAFFSLAGLRLAVPARREYWMGPLLGTANGILTGMTGAFVVPGVLYLQALGLDRHALVQAMGMLFLVSTLALAVALGVGGFSGWRDLGLSTLGLVPALAGMVLGRRVRDRLSEALFRRLFFLALLALGLAIVAKTFL